MTKHKWGSEARGGDDDGDPVPGKERKVEIENAYFEKLKARLGQQPTFTPEPTTAEPEKPAGPVIYNEDGSVYQKPVGHTPE
jgi:hypothetical protein